MELQLINIVTLKGKLELLSGLRVGAGDSEMHIGGVDATTIKDPFTGNPYIPGSSIKGKLRSLLEQASGAIIFSNGKPLKGDVIGNSNLTESQKKFGESIIKLFGFMSSPSDSAILGPTRISVSDAMLDSDWEKKSRENDWQKTEVKPETAIDRIKGTALHGSLRSIERIPAGTQFAFQISVKIFKENEEQELVEKLLLPGIKLLEQDYLGGMGSRGYGRVRFLFEDAKIQERFNSMKPFDFFPKR